MGERNRRLGVLCVSIETRENLKDTILHRLEMMAISAGTEKEKIWENILGFLTDKASENPGLVQEVADEIGASHCPGEFFCVIHTVLGFDRSESKFFLQLQSNIGVSKLFSNLNYVDLDTDSFDAVNTALDCISRLISPQFSHKSWSRYRQFSDYLEQKGKKNLSFAQRDRRFGGAAACAVVVNHHWDDLQEHLNTLLSQQQDRNQLACAVRTILSSEVVRFLVVSKAVVGFILHEPFINSVVEQNISRTQLLTVLPALYMEMRNPQRDVTDLSKPSLPALTSAWSEICYPKEAVNSLKNFIGQTDKTALRKTVEGLLREDAECLARQRGPEYGFGNQKNIDSNQNVLKQLPEEKEHLLDVVPPDNLESEHYFGDFTQRLSKVGSKHIEHVSESITIASSADLAFATHKWRSKEFRETFSRMKECRRNFNMQQERLRKNTENDQDQEDLLAAGRKKAAALEKLKVHGGPVTNTEDIEEILRKFPKYKTDSEASTQTRKLKAILRREITYARDYIFDNLKKTGNPLFKINKLSVNEMLENLQVLYGQRGEQITADIEDVRDALQLMDGSPEDGIGDTEDSTKFRKDQVVVFKLDSKLGIGIIEDVHPGEVWVLPLQPLETEGTQDFLCQLWSYPVPLKLLDIKTENVLPCYPNIELDKICSKNSNNHQMIIFRLLNDDIIKLFCDTSK